MKRRDFLSSVIGAGSATILGVPQIVSSSVFGRSAPSNRINVGFIGLGNQSQVDLPAFLQNPDVQVVAVCDVNEGSHGYLTDDQFLGRVPGQNSVNEYYAAQTKSGRFAGCDAYSDYRELLARDDIDAVVVIVPDHWHALISIDAVVAGKDVYCEKPLSLTVEDGQAMVKAVRKYQRILQTGSQFRSDPRVRHMCELVRNGYIGRLERIRSFIAKNNAVDPGPGWKPMPVPKGFDYDMWLGPAPYAPYHTGRCLYRFRFNLDYSGGPTTNFGAHCNDIAQWGHGSDLSGPVEFEDTGSEWPPEGSLYTTATKVAFRARYADGVELICETGEPYFGTRFEGTEGWLQFDFKGLHASSESLMSLAIGPNEIHLPRSLPELEDSEYPNRSVAHVANFVNSVKKRQEPIEPVEIGHSTATLCHLGNIAMRLKRRIQWDPEHEQIVNDPDASEYLRRPMRAPWALPVL